MSSNHAYAEVYLKQHYVIKFDSDLWQIGVVKKWEYQLMQYAIICMECVIMSGMSRGLRNVQLLEECHMISGMCVIMLGMSRGLRMYNYFRNAYNYLQNVTWFEKYINILGLSRCLINCLRCI